MQFERVIEGYWLAKRRDFSPNTFRDYSITFRRFQEFIGDTEFEAITSADVHRFLNYLADELGLAAKTRSNAWIALSSLWTWAEQELSTEHVIRRHVKRPRYHTEKPRAFTKREVRLLLDACNYMTAWSTKRGNYIKMARPTANRDRAIFIMLLDTGIRVSELTDLTITDYNQQTGQLQIRHGKGNKHRVVFLGQAGQQAIWKYLAKRTAYTPHSPLFATRTDHKLDRIAVLRLVNRAGLRAGVDNAYPHRFRHTFAITFLRNGGTPLELQRLLGHEKLNTVLIYVELANIDLAAAHTRASPVDNWKL